MRDAFQTASHHMQQAGAANKRRYDAKVRSVYIATGDHVLLRNMERGSTGKMRSWWADKIYVVQEVYDHVPVYVITPLDGGSTKTVHRNMLMKVNNLPVDIFGQVPIMGDTPTPAMRPKRRRPLRPRSVAVALSSDSSSDSGAAVYVPVAGGVPERAPLPGPSAVLSDSGSDTDEGLRRFEET